MHDWELVLDSNRTYIIDDQDNLCSSDIFGHKNFQWLIFEGIKTSKKGHFHHSLNQIEEKWFIWQNLVITIIAKPRPVHRHRPEIPEPAPSLFGYEAPVGGIQVFPAIKIHMICQVHMNCSLSVKIKRCETPHSTQRSRTHFVYFVSTCVVSKNRNTPSWSSMADDAITRGGIGVLGSPFYTTSVFLYYMKVRVFYVSKKFQEIRQWPVYSKEE